MGLDFTELVMAFEEEFDIRFDIEMDDDLSSVGGLYGEILFLLRSPEKRVCKTPAIFLKVRGALTEVVGLDRRDVKLDMSLSRVCPPGQRRRLWRELRGRGNFALPTLPTVVPGTVFVLVALVAGLPLAIVMNLCIFSLVSRLDVLHIVPEWCVGTTFAVLMFAVPSVLFLSQHFFPVRFPSDCDTPRALVRRSLETQAIGGDGRVWSSAAVWTRFREMIAERLDVDIEQVTPDVDFLKDLGVD